MVELLVGQSERHVTLTNRTSLTNLICIRFHSSKIRKISCRVESLDEDVRYMVYKWYMWCIYTGFCMDEYRNQETNVGTVMFRRFHEKPRNFSVLWKHATFTLPFVVRLAGFEFKGCEGPNRNRAWVIHQIERISQRKPIITKGMRHCPWVCDVDMQISNDCLYFTFNVKHPTSIVQDVPRTEHTTAYMYMSISNEANNN